MCVWWEHSLLEAQSCGPGSALVGPRVCKCLGNLTKEGKLPSSWKNSLCFCLPWLHEDQNCWDSKKLGNAYFSLYCQVRILFSHSLKLNHVCILRCCMFWTAIKMHVSVTWKGEQKLLCCIINYVQEMKSWSVFAESTPPPPPPASPPPCKAKDWPGDWGPVRSYLLLWLCALTLEVQVPGSCGDLRCDFCVDLYSVEIAGVPWYHHIVPLIVIERFIWAPFDEVSTISQIKHVM